PVGPVATIAVALPLPIVVTAVPLNFTVLVPWVEPKFAPVIVTDAPTAPVVGDKLVMLGAATTVNDTPLLFTPLAFTTTLPVVAPVGTVATIDVALQLPIVVTAVPLKLTVPVPWVEPKFVPVIVTDAPTAPEVGDKLVTPGAATTVNETPLLFTPLAFTTTLPVVAPVGTVATIDVALQLPIVVTAVPLNFTVLVPWVEPKFAPVIVTDAPTAPVVGDKLVMLGAATTVNDTPLLFTPLAFTTTLPVVAPVGTVATIDVALQLPIVVTAVPLKLTVPVPWVEPKFVPVIVTDAPTAPEVGDKLVTPGAATTVNETPLLFTPLAFTTTLPVVAPVGTVATIDVALQLPIVVTAVPLNFTVLVPWVEPKFAPVIVTDAPTAPVVGDKLVMLGAATTVNDTPLLFTPLAFTTTLPVVAPVGTVATIDVALQLPIVVTAVPLKLTVPVPWVEPKFVPVIVTDAPTAPEVGDKLVTPGAATTVNETPLLFTPLAFTTTLPVVAPVGTVATIDVALQLPIVVTAVPLNFTVLVPWVEPKFVPVIVTDAPTAPVVGDKLVMLGAATTVNDTPLLALLPTVTTTLPVVAPVGTVATIDVALQLPMVVAVVPLNFTVLVPWVDPKFNPVIVTDAPTAPEVGDKLVMLGNTVNAAPLLFTPLANTTTLPVVAPVGTVTLIDVALQLVTVAVVPLNFTVPVPWVEPKFVPVTVTAAPAAPEVGERLVMLGAATTVNDTPLLAVPLTVTTTLPVVAPVGTVATIEVALQLPIVVTVVPL